MAPRSRDTVCVCLYLTVFVSLLQLGGGGLFNKPSGLVTGGLGTTGLGTGTGLGGGLGALQTSQATGLGGGLGLLNKQPPAGGLGTGLGEWWSP